MKIFYFMIPVSIGLASLFVYGFILAVKRGQYDDLETPAVRAILDDEVIKTEINQGEEKS